MSISNLLVNNSYDLKSKSLASESITITDKVTTKDLDVSGVLQLTQGNGYPSGWSSTIETNSGAKLFEGDDDNVTYRPAMGVYSSQGANQRGIYIWAGSKSGNQQSSSDWPVTTMVIDDSVTINAPVVAQSDLTVSGKPYLRKNQEGVFSSIPAQNHFDILANSNPTVGMKATSSMGLRYQLDYDVTSENTLTINVSRDAIINGFSMDLVVFAHEATPTQTYTVTVKTFTDDTLATPSLNIADLTSTSEALSNTVNFTVDTDRFELFRLTSLSGYPGYAQTEFITMTVAKMS